MARKHYQDNRGNDYDNDDNDDDDDDYGQRRSGKRIRRSELDSPSAAGRRHDNNSNTNNATVFVGNLSYQTSWQNLKDHMRQAGNVESANIMMKQEGRGGRSGSGRSKGCGLVTYQHAREAERAVRDLDGSTLDSRTIFVSRDKRGEQTHGGGGVDQSNSHSNHHRSSGNTASASSSSLYVGNLSYETRWQDLKDLFRSCGTVDHVEIMERPDGTSKGFGTVRFAHPGDATRAIAKLDRTEWQGRPLQVRWDRDAAAAPARMESRGRDNSNRNDSHNDNDSGGVQLWVGNLPYETRWQELKDAFKSFGRVDNVEIVEGSDGRKKGFGIVRFFHSNDADFAMRKMNGANFQGRPMEVKLDDRAGGGGGGERQQQIHPARNPRKAPRDSGARGGSSSKSQHKGGTKLYVGNLPFEASWQDVKDYFRQCGKVTNAEVIEGPDGKKKGFGIVDFVSEDDASDAIRRLDGADFKGRKLQVRFDKRPDIKASANRKPDAGKDSKPAAKSKEETYNRENALDSALSSGR